MAEELHRRQAREREIRENMTGRSLQLIAQDKRKAVVEAKRTADEKERERQEREAIDKKRQQQVREFRETARPS